MKLSHEKGEVYMQISKVLMDYVSDGDAHIKLESVEHSTNLREIVTVGYMIEEYQAQTKKEQLSATNT